MTEVGEYRRGLDFIVVKSKRGEENLPLCPCWTSRMAGHNVKDTAETPQPPQTPIHGEVAGIASGLLVGFLGFLLPCHIALPPVRET